MKNLSNLFLENRFKVFTIFFATTVGILVRYPYLTSKEAFPFGDGGLFVEMIYAIKNNNFVLPSFVSFNDYQIPFAYPPFSFYLALLSAKVFGLSILETVQILPVVLNLFSIVVFVLLVSELIQDKVELFLCSGLFSIILQVYLWGAKGGGLSRSSGLLFTTLTLYLFLLYKNRTSKNYLLFSAVALGFTAASHLEWALIAAVSLLVFILFFGKYKTRQDVYNLLIFGFSSAVIVIPWWGAVIYRFGITPFSTAWGVFEMNINQFIEKFFAGAIFRIAIFSSRDYFLPILGVIGFIYACFIRERRLLPVWLLATYIVAPKNSPISGLLPLVMLVAMGLRSLDQGLLYLIGGIKSAFRKYFQPSISIFYLFAVMFLSVPRLYNKPILSILTPVERTAMEYVKENTPSNAKFIVLTPYDWHSADAAEWFPYLAKRHSATTPQGLEWVSATEFNQIVEKVADLSQMVRDQQAGKDDGQLASYVEANFSDYDYVAIFADHIGNNFGGFLETADYEVFYRKRDVLILKLTSGPH